MEKGWWALDWQHIALLDMEHMVVVLSYTWELLVRLVLSHMEKWHPRCCLTLGAGQQRWSPDWRQMGVAMGGVDGGWGAVDSHQVGTLIPLVGERSWQPTFAPFCNPKTPQERNFGQKKNPEFKKSSKKLKGRTEIDAAGGEKT